MRTREDGYSLIDLMAVVALAGILTAITIPISETSLRANRLKGDADAVRNLVGLAKMRASSQFTRARVFVDLSNNSYVLQVWDRTANAWVNDRAPANTSSGVSFGFGSLGTPPPNTQATIEMSPPCSNGVTADAGVVANTSCITFNSRGLPVDGAGVLYARHAIYMQSTIGVFATTVTSTPLIRFWSSPNGTAVWTPR